MVITSCQKYVQFSRNVLTVIPRLTRFPIARICITQFFDLVQKNLHNAIFIGAELGGAAGARAPPLLHNPRKFVIYNENSPKFPVPALY